MCTLRVVMTLKGLGGGGVEDMMLKTIRWLHIFSVVLV